MSDYFLIAVIRSISDQDGSVIINSHSDFPDHFFSLKKVFIDFFGQKKELVLEYVKYLNDSFVFKFLNFDSAEDVEFLLGKELYVDDENLYKLPNDAFYIHDLIGCEIYKESLFFGILIDVLKLPASDIYVIKKNNNEIMIPAASKYFSKIDIKNKKIFLSEENSIFNED